MFCLGDFSQDYFINELKGVGVIMSTDTPTDIAFTTIIPGSTVLAKDGYKIDQYINTTKYVLSRSNIIILNIVAHSDRYGHRSCISIAFINTVSYYKKVKIKAFPQY